MKMTSSGGFSYCLVNQTLLFHKKRKQIAELRLPKKTLENWLERHLLNIIHSIPQKFETYNITNILLLLI